MYTQLTDDGANADVPPGLYFDTTARFFLNSFLRKRRGPVPIVHISQIVLYLLFLYVIGIHILDFFCLVFTSVMLVFLRVLGASICLPQKE
jgi:hypothetical protein